MRTLFGTLGLVCSLSAAFPQTLLETGFEPPEFSLGNLAGQSGWQAFHLSTPNTATISDAFAFSGTQSVRMAPVAGASSSWWWKPVGYNTGGSGYITVIWDMYLSASTVQAAYGVDCYDPDALRIAAMRVNNLNRVQLVQDNGFTTTIIDTGVVYPRNTWARFKLELNYNMGRFRLIMNNRELGSANLNSAADTLFADADIWIVNVTGNADDFGHYDNFRVIASSAPLPDADINGDGCVDDADLLTVLFAFGSTDPIADVSGDGIVDDADLLEVLFSFGQGC